VETDKYERLSMLLNKIPISHSIFEPGFYVKGKNIKFRISLWDAMVSYKFPYVDILFLFIFLIIFAVYLIFSDIRFLWVPIWIFWGLFGEKIWNMFFYSLFPSSSFDVTNKIFRHYHITSTVINFDDIVDIEVRRNQKVYFGSMGFETCLYLDSKNHIPFQIARFHNWEEFWIETYIDSIKSFFEIEILIKYVDYK
jgi:hypothetical protein